MPEFYAMATQVAISKLTLTIELKATWIKTPVLEQ